MLEKLRFGGIHKKVGLDQIIECKVHRAKNIARIYKKR